MKRNPARPIVVAASLVAAAAVIGADTTPKKESAAPAQPAAAAPAAPAAEASKKDEVVAKVNGEEIKTSDVDEAIGKVLAQRGMPANAIPPGQRDMIVRSMLDDLILDKLVTKASATVKIPDAEVMGEWDKIRQRRGGTEEEIKAELAKMGMTVDTVKADIRDRMQKRKWVDDQITGKFTEPTEAEAKEFYDKNPQHFEQPETVRASHILFKVEQNAKPEQVTAAMKKAEETIARTKKEDFTKLAQELSEDPSAKQNGGDLDFFPRQGAMVEEFAAAAFKLKKDEITAEPVRSQFGYHIIKVTDRKAAEKQPFDAAKPQITNYLSRERKDEAVQAVLKKLRDDAKVEVLLPPPAAPTPGAVTPAVPAPEAAPAEARKPVEAVTPPVSAPPVQPKKK